MSVEIIDSIRNAEEEALNIRKTAKQQAKQILDDADKKAKEIVETAEKNAYLKAEEIIEQAKLDTQKLTDAQNKAFDEKAEQMKTDAQAKLDDAAEYIIKELFGL